MIGRALLVALLGIWLVAPSAAADKPLKVGFLGPAGRDEIEKPFWQGLRDLGWIEGQNITFERRLVSGGGQRYPEFAAELVKLKPDLLMAIATPATTAMTNATSSIPIVFIDVADPVASGFAQSLARPGRNATGMSGINVELSAKRLELLHAALPRVSRVAVVACCFGTAADPVMERFLDDTHRASRAMKIHVEPIRLKNYDDLDTLFTTIVRVRSDAVVFLPNAQMTSVRRRVVDLATRHRLPTMFDGKPAADSGGLMAYGIDRDEMYRRAASVVDRVLKGVTPAEIPVEQPTKMKFVVNLRTAKAIGVTIPPSVLLRADEVIE